MIDLISLGYFFQTSVNLGTDLIPILSLVLNAGIGVYVGSTGARIRIMEKQITELNRLILTHIQQRADS